MLIWGFIREGEVWGKKCRNQMTKDESSILLYENFQHLRGIEDANGTSY